MPPKPYKPPHIHIDFNLDDPYSIPRWMCVKCGLIFDFQFELGPGDSGWPEEVDPYAEEVEFLCPRCGALFDEKPPVPISFHSLEASPDLSKINFFVEDNVHELVVREVAKQLKKDVIVTPLSESGIVKIMFRYSKSRGGWPNCYFMIDGDNQGNPFKGEPNFIHLEKYCVENYLLDFDICSAISGKSVRQIRKAIIDLLKENRRIIFEKDHNKYFEFLFDRLTISDVDDAFLSKYDVSVMFEQFLKCIGIKNKEQFIKAYIAYCYSQSQMNILPIRLVEVIQRVSI